VLYFCASLAALFFAENAQPFRFDPVMNNAPVEAMKV
jgi:hypothetical protein